MQKQTPSPQREEGETAMSMPREETVKCPKCGEENKFTCWQSINTEMDFAIPDIISGKLFEMKCQKCGHVTHVHYPMLFNDMIHGVMINYVMPEAVEEAERIANYMSERMDFCRFRIVTSQTDLREKTGIFDAGLDDRVVEILKLLIMAQIQDQVKDRGVHGVYYVPGEEPVIEILMKDGSGHVPVGSDMYAELEKQIRPRLAVDKEYFIDQNWAAEFLAEDKVP